MLHAFQTVVEEIDACIAEIMGFQKEFVENLRAVVRILAERRIFRIMRARSEAIKSEEEPRIHAIVFEQAEYDKKQPMGEDMPELRNGQSEAFV